MQNRTVSELLTSSLLHQITGYSLFTRLFLGLYNPIRKRVNSHQSFFCFYGRLIGNNRVKFAQFHPLCTRASHQAEDSRIGACILECSVVFERKGREITFMINLSSSTERCEAMGEVHLCGNGNPKLMLRAITQHNCDRE